ncbi:MAG TPA: transcription antitermination factor NusB [Sedimentisphaerales bacterium]|nr:transcription antitermination factor NusB [Sedimentisphaerales bacterium]
MSLEKLHPARRTASHILDLVDADRGDVAGTLYSHIDRVADRALLTDLVFGVVRNRSCIDNVICRISQVPSDRISPELLNILRVGVYEIIFCPDREMYAIVSETMKETRGLSDKRRGFVNAVLRKTCRLIAERSTSLPAAPPTFTVPVTPDRGCRFSIGMLADPAQNPGQYLSSAFSLPQWLVEGWVNAYGFEDAMQACFGSNRRPSIYIRPNTIKADGMELFRRFRQEQIECDIVIDDGLMLQTKSGRPIEKLPGYAEGFFSVQDITSSEAVRMLAPQPGWNVLDMCAAPGGKTIQIAQIMNDQGTITATDFDAVRLERVKHNIERLGIRSVKIMPYTAVADMIAAAHGSVHGKVPLGGFDAVLVDVPCSNTGVMARRCEVRCRIRRAAIDSLTAIQRKLLAEAMALVRPGGRVCYSTCSIEPAENQEVVRHLLGENQAFELLAEQLTLPAAGRIDRDGGYAAVIRKG